MRNLATSLSKQLKGNNILFSDKQFYNLLNSLSLLAIGLDKNGLLTYCNSAFCALLNKEEKDIIGQTLDQIIPLTLATGSSIKANDFIENGYLETIILLDNQQYFIAWSITQVYTNDNQLIGINAIGNDISEIQQLKNETLLKLEEKENYIKEIEDKISILEESERNQSVYLANLSHEVRTPINGIIGFAELLKEEYLDEEKREKYIETIQQTSTKLLYILNDILDTSKLSTGHIKLIYEDVNLNDLIEHLCDIYRLDKESDNLKLIVKKGLPDAYAKMILDETHIYQILNKLLRNAFEYTQTGVVEVGYELKDNQIHLFVKDTGCGIEKDKLKTILELSAYDKEHELLMEGTELSLPIIKRRIEMMEGSIQIISHENVGTSIFLALPHTIALPTKNKVKKEKPLSAIYSDKLVLLVEDDIFSISVMKEIFDSLNMPIIHTSSGMEAIQICEENKDINLVLMDIRLPDILGTEATMHIKKIRPDLPIIAQTANASTADKELCLNAGCDSYITKPIHIGNLKKMLYRYLIEQS